MAKGEEKHYHRGQDGHEGRFESIVVAERFLARAVLWRYAAFLASLAGTFARSTVSPSAAVGWVKMVSRSVV